MASIVKPNTFSAGATIIASEHNDNFDTIFNEFNGSISNANIDASAAIVDTKLAQISTAGKVTIGALTIASQAQGDVAYYNGSAWTRLGAGTSGQFLKTQGAAANPVWANAAGFTSQNLVEATGDVTTTSTTFTDLTTMTITYTPGDASNLNMFFFSGTFRNNTTNLDCDIILDDGANISASRRTSSNATAGERQNLATTYQETLAASSKTVKVQWLVEGGTGTCSQRVLHIVELPA